MILKVDHTCYTHLMWLLTYRPREFACAVSKYECAQPNFAAEGMAGYVPCELTFEIRDLQLFAKIWDEWYSASSRQELYNQITRSRC